MKHLTWISIFVMMEIIIRFLGSVEEDFMNAGFLSPGISVFKRQPINTRHKCYTGFLMIHETSVRLLNKLFNRLFRCH